MVNGATVFGFLLLPRLTHRLGGPSLSALQSLWFVVFLLTPGVFGPLEQATSARIAAARARGGADRSVVRAAVRSTLVLTVFTSGLVAVASPVLVRRAFDGNRTLAVALFVGVAGNGALFLVEGVLSGRHRFGSYAATLAFEGSLRFAACVCLVAVGVRTVSAYAALVALTPWAALPFSLLWDRWSARRAQSGPDAVAGSVPATGTAARLAQPVPAGADAAGFGRAVAHLLGGQLALQAMLNVAPIAATLLATSTADKTRAADFGTAFVVSRVPLFLYQAVLVALLAQLAGLVAAGHEDRVRTMLTRLCAAVIVLGALGTALAFVLGRVLSDRLLGTHAFVGRSTWAMVVGANAIGLLALTLSVALMARGRLARYGLGWLVGAAVAVMVTAGASSLIHRVSIGYLVGMLAATGALLTFVAQPAPTTSPELVRAD